MDLTNFFREGDIENFDKVVEENAFAPSNMELNMIEQVNLNQDKDVDKKEKEDILIHRKACIKDIKRLFAIGKTAREVKKQVLSKYAKPYLPSDFDKILAKNDGLIGTVLADCSCFENSAEYGKLSSAIRSGHQYAINCSCKKHARKQFVANGGNIDSFITDDDDWSEVPIIGQRCSKTNLPVISSLDNYTTENAIQAMDRLAKINLITAEEKRSLLSENKAIVAVKKAFLLIEFKKNAKAENKVTKEFDFKLSEIDNNTINLCKDKNKEEIKISNLNSVDIEAPVEEVKGGIILEFPESENEITIPCQKDNVDFIVTESEPQSDLFEEETFDFDLDDINKKDELAIDGRSGWTI